MSKYLIETYYTCSFKVNHYLDDINEENLKNLENPEGLDWTGLAGWLPLQGRRRG